MSQRQLLIFAIAGALLMAFLLTVVLRTDVLDRYLPAPVPTLQTPEEHARAAVESHRSRLRDLCGAGVEGPLPIRLALAFDAAGKQTSLGVVDDEGRTPEAVHVCLHQQLGLTLTIPPPGEPVAVEVPFPFP